MENNEQSSIISIKKTWFKSINPIKFKIKDISNNEIVIDYEEYNEIKSQLQKAEKSIINYLKENKSQSFTRKELFEEFKDELTQYSIKNALKDMENRGLIESTGHTKDKLFQVIQLPI